MRVSGACGTAVATVSLRLCHGRAGPGHPRLAVLEGAKSWVAGARPAMTQWEHLPASSLSELSCRVAGLAVPEWRAWDALEERLPAFANSGHLFPVSRGRIVPPQHPFCGDSPFGGSGSGCEGEQPLHVVGHGHEVPLAADVVETAEQELAEPER